MSQIKLITFDATNTLFKVCGSVGNMYAKTASRYGIKTNPEKLDNNFRKGLKQFNTEYPNFGQIVGMSSQQWWNSVVGITFDGEIESHILDAISSDLYHNFTLKTHWELFPDVLPTLEHFKNKDIKIGVLSNFDERLPAIIKELEIERYFTFILASRNTKWYKPSPQIFHRAAAMVTKCLPTEVVHIGDSVELDYKAARNAGMDAYLLSRQTLDSNLNKLINKGIPEDKIITNLEQLCNLI